MSKEISEEYASSLADLTVNSKPLINMLTILAEENIEHAGVIVETVEKHLEKVHPDIKLPVLYLVDSIIKNVGGAYTQKFSQSIVNMFTRTFKQVDEKIRSQMFKLRETWHDVFPATKLYQLDVKVNLIDPAWPIQAQPQQSNIHPPASTPVLTDEERTIIAKKEQELLMLQKKKIELELEQTRKQLEVAEKNAKKVVTAVPPVVAAATAPVAPAATPLVSVAAPEVTPVPVRQRLGPPINKTGSRIAPVSAGLAAMRRDPRLARAPAPARPAPPAAPPAIAPHVFDIKPLDRVTKRKNVITIDVRCPAPAPRPSPRRDPRLHKRGGKAPAPNADGYVDALPDPKKISKLPPIPKIVREAPSSNKKRKDSREKKKKRDDGKESSSGSSPDKRLRAKNGNKAQKKKEPDAPVAFKELKNYVKGRYMRRNKEPSESPERPEAAASSVPDVVVENKDIDLRVLPPASEPPPAPVALKRSSTETLEPKPKRNKLDKFDILFGNEDVDLRKLPQVEEILPVAPLSPKHNDESQESGPDKVVSPHDSPKQKDWNEVKEKTEKKAPSKLDLVRAKLAEATKGKDRLGRPLLFSKSPSIERERKRTLSSEDTDLRNENSDEYDTEDHKKTISIIMSQAKEQYSDGQIDKNQYNTLVCQVLQLNEKLKLKEAKQRESLEVSKRRLNAHILEDSFKVASPKSSPGENNYGDIDERVPPTAYLDALHNGNELRQDSDMRAGPADQTDGHKAKGLLPRPPMMPMFGPFPPMWRGQPHPRMDEYGPRRFRGPMPFFRGKFDNRLMRPPFDPRMTVPLPTPKLGICQGESPLEPYVRSESPPPLGAPGFVIPPTDYRILEYIEQDPVKTIQIDGVPREIRFYGDTAVIMLDWDDPREIKFLPGSRRVTFDNKDSVVLSFNEESRQIEIDDQVFDIKFGAPTRELCINGRWYECFFGGQPVGVLIDGRPRLVQLEGPLPQVDIGKAKRTELVAGKINLIVNATQMCPVYLDAKVQKFTINGQFFTIRFVDSLKTVLINEQPFKVEFGDLPKPISIGNEKFFIRFSALPRNVKPGYIQIANMEGVTLPSMTAAPAGRSVPQPMDTDQEPDRAVKTPSPDINNENQGLEMLASVMPSSIVPASASEYSVAEPLFGKTDMIPGLDTPADEKPKPTLPILDNINVNDLFAKLVATGIVQVQNDSAKDLKIETKVEEKIKPKEDKDVTHKVDLLKPETLRSKQGGVVRRLYGGMQCSGCGARFPPEHTVRYSQHLDWHFRQNRRDRDSARRAHSRHWHYDLSDWLQYEEIDELDDREKNWFESAGSEGGEAGGAGAAGAGAGGAEESSAAGARPRCALCGDAFHMFYNHDKDEWQLRNSVRHHDDNYHPSCFEDYKASLAKEEEKEKVEETAPEKVEEDNEPIEIKDFDDTLDQSDNESVVEVIEPPVEIPEPLLIDEGDEDDVVLKAEPIVQVEVQDDDDTDDETVAHRAERDRLARIDFSNVKVKQEPLDPDDEPIITAEEESIPAPSVDMIQPTVHTSIDGNVQLEAPAVAHAIPLNTIRINISKSLPLTQLPVSNNGLEDISADDEPLPPGEEVELEYTLKPTLEGIKFSRQPPVQKGNELSGLCSIM
ncbi:pre-mRNA cleavage complex 2 protein Pcf11 isoform X2 [Bombyx mori]|uniref:Pre-mRNA cleavage complex 2 protein Pcf11 n=1 Tax=Bombyx mori TaxID=7091 RepID=A0A8R2M0R4_BOMMO|nr:pre-mRNA cleavage complex 2 protein Pcf11 isoform X2 [Bombyx mori]